MAKKKKSTADKEDADIQKAARQVLEEAEAAIYEIRQHAKPDRCSQACGYEMAYEDLTDAEITGALKMLVRAYVSGVLSTERSTALLITHLATEERIRDAEGLNADILDSKD